MSEYSLKVTPRGPVYQFEFRQGDTPLYQLTVPPDGTWYESSQPWVGFGVAVSVIAGQFTARLRNGPDRREWVGAVPERDER